jgi:hypothetical protein
MGTASWEVYSGKCSCGKGNYVISESQPDHGWSFRTSLHGDIACEECAKNYELVLQKGHFAVVKAESIAAQKVAKEEWYRRRRSFMESEATQSLLTEAVAALDALPSTAARYRVLSRIMHTGSISTFRKDAGGAEGIRGWIQRHTSPDDITGLLKWLEKDHPSMRTEAETIHRIWQESQADLPEEGIIYEKK